MTLLLHIHTACDTTLGACGFSIILQTVEIVSCSWHYFARQSIVVCWVYQTLLLYNNILVVRVQPEGFKKVLKVRSF